VRLNYIRECVKLFLLFLKKCSTAQLPLPPIINSVRVDALTYLDDAALNDLFQQVNRIELQRIEGDLIEAGCALGGSAIVIAAAKSPERFFFVYDVFGMIPPPSEQDGTDVHNRYNVIKNVGSQGIRGNRYYGYEENLYEKVIDNFRRHGVPVEENNTCLVKGLFENTMNINRPVVLAHLDCDWYESVMTCLQRITPYLVHGGVLVIDDYNHWSGCRKAVDTYFRNKRNEYQFINKARLHIVRK
jgi:asparagine synthase (glutamine-hydrolysing)